MADDYVDDEFSYQEYDFQGAAGFSFGGVKADVIDCEDSFLLFFTITMQPHASTCVYYIASTYFFSIHEISL